MYTDVRRYVLFMMTTKYGCLRTFYNVVPFMFTLMLAYNYCDNDYRNNY